MSEQRVTRTNDYTGVGLAIGVAVGGLIGIAMDSISVGFGIGIALGLSISELLEKRRKDREERGAIK
jgi:hypothetical protein